MTCELDARNYLKDYVKKDAKWKNNQFTVAEYMEDPQSPNPTWVCELKSEFNRCIRTIMDTTVLNRGRRSTGYREGYQESICGRKGMEEIRRR